ncbi:uncharacterized protein V6R79_006463 [Siganus canaliculatus]
MAPALATYRSTSLLSCLLLFFTAVTASKNTTISNSSATVLGHLNATYDDVGNSTSGSMPIEFDATTEPPLCSITEKTTEPLPVSGRLSDPLIQVGSLCPCEENKDECDIGCCCDKKCREVIPLFTGCSPHTISGNKQLCSQEVVSYSLLSKIDGYSELQSSVQRETNSDVLCIHSYNRFDGLSHPKPTVPTDENFDTLFKYFTNFIFGSEENSAQLSQADHQAQSGYKYGDVMGTAEDSGQRGVFLLPAAGVTAECVDASPAAFLKDQTSVCSRHVSLGQDCSSLTALSMDTYTNIQLSAGQNEDTLVVPVEVSSVFLQSVDGTQTELKMSDEDNFRPVFLNSTLCAHVVLKICYVIQYNPAGEIVRVTASVVLGFARGSALSLEQEFRITFVQEDVEEPTVHYSGNPGYVVEQSLLSGTQTDNGIARSISPKDSLSVVQSTGNQDCVQGSQQHSSVQFGVDSVSGCTLRLEDAANCSLISEILLDVLRGPNYPLYVASFGNSPLNRPLDWVSVKNTNNRAQSCNIPLSLHLEVEWTKYGSLVNPQIQIVSVRETIQTNTTSLALLSGGSSVLPIWSSVAFKSVSSAATKGYRAMPTINAKLPFDFFFPFV